MATRWKIAIIVGLAIVAWLAYREAAKQAAIAKEHTDRVAASNAMIGIVKTVIEWL